MRIFPFTCSALAFVLVCLSLKASAQEPRTPWLQLPSEVEAGEGRFGTGVSGMPDADGDGFGDVVIGAPEASPGNSPNNAGRVLIYSGATGAFLHTLSSPTERTNGQFGYYVSGLEDVDGDTFGDVIVGSLNEKPIYVFSGKTGSLIYTLESHIEDPISSQGRSVAGTPDLDGDDCGDIIIGTPWAFTGAGRAYIYSGSTGELLHTLISDNVADNAVFGQSVSGIPDVNGDDMGDVVVGAFQEDLSGPFVNAAGRAYIFSGADGTLLHTLESPTPRTGGLFGWAVSGVPDIDGDNRGDVIVGARREGPTDFNPTGRAHVFSGATGSPIHTLLSPSPSVNGYFGQSLSCVDDINGDGISDIAIGAQDEGFDPRGRVHLFSGSDGEHFHTITSPNPFFGFIGWSVSAVPDADGDGRGDLIIGDLEGSPGLPEDGGYAYIFDSSQLFPQLDINLSAHIEPAFPGTLDDLECVTSIESKGNETGFSMTYRWFKNDSPLFEDLEVDGEVFSSVSGPILSHHFTQKHDALFCEARVTDGLASVEARSDPVTILNTLPTQPDVRILPLIPTPDDGFKPFLSSMKAKMPMRTTLFI